MQLEAIASCPIALNGRQKNRKSKSPTVLPLTNPELWGEDICYAELKIKTVQ